MVLANNDTFKGLSTLKDTIRMKAEEVDFRAPIDGEGEGTVLEIQKERFVGDYAVMVPTVGTFKPGDWFVSGTAYGQVAKMMSLDRQKLTTSTLSQPMILTGFADSKMPSPGDMILGVPSRKEAQRVRSLREVASGRRAASLEFKEQAAEAIREIELEHFDRIEAVRLGVDEDKYVETQRRERENIKSKDEVPLLLKVDLAGSAEAILDGIQSLPRSKEVYPRVVRWSIGDIKQEDITMASLSPRKCTVLGFNVKLPPKIQQAAQKSNVEVKDFKIIYSLLNHVTRSLEARLKPKVAKKLVGNAEVMEVFSLSVRKKIVLVAGCRVERGEINKGALCEVVRDDEVVVDEVRIKSLRHFKEKVQSVSTGMECGIDFGDWRDWKAGDKIRVYDTYEIKRKLGEEEEEDENEGGEAKEAAA